MIAVLVIVFIIQPVKVEGTSMLPRLHDGERIFVNKLIYYDEFNWAPKVDRGDIVVFWFPDEPTKSYIKRVIGLPGDTVEVHEGLVRVNGRDIEEDYLDPSLNLAHRTQPPIYVKPNYYFVMLSVGIPLSLNFKSGEITRTLTVISVYVASHKQISLKCDKR